jgi:hypothetical protein
VPSFIFPSLFRINLTGSFFSKDNLIALITNKDIYIDRYICIVLLKILYYNIEYLYNINTNLTTITDNNNWIPFAGGGGSGGSEYWLNPAISVLNIEPTSPTNGDRYIAGLNSASTVSGTNSSSSTGGDDVESNSTLSDWDKTSPKNGY